MYNKNKEYKIHSYIYRIHIHDLYDIMLYHEKDVIELIQM